jgi:hypothetical protein
LIINSGAQKTVMTFCGHNTPILQVAQKPLYLTIHNSPIVDSSFMNPPPSYKKQNQKMTVLQLSHSPLTTCALTRKTVGFTVDDDAMLQSSNKRRRYQRRGSKAPSMMMACFNSRTRQIDDIDLLEIQRRLLADKEFLRSLQLADAGEDSRTKCMKRLASLELVAKPSV